VLVHGTFVALPPTTNQEGMSDLHKRTAMHEGPGGDGYVHSRENCRVVDFLVRSNPGFPRVSSEMQSPSSGLAPVPQVCQIYILRTQSTTDGCACTVLAYAVCSILSSMQRFPPAATPPAPDGMPGRYFAAQQLKLAAGPQIGFGRSEARGSVN
jgi:hypothetical protein